MTLENISNIDGLFAVINQCTGNVELISDEGDCINLKSRLAQYMTVAGAFSDGYIRSLRLRVEKDEDKVRIFDFILSGEAEKYFRHSLHTFYIAKAAASCSPSRLRRSLFFLVKNVWYISRLGHNLVFKSISQRISAFSVSCMSKSLFF